MAQNEKTSPEIASLAGELPGNPNTPKKVKKVAGSALTQAKNKPKHPTKKGKK